MATVYYFVFKVILKVRITHYPVFILSGVLPWAFFAQSIQENLEGITANWGLVSKVPIPIQIFSYVGVLTNLVTLSLSLPVLLAVALLSGSPVTPAVLALPFYALALFLITYGLSLGFSIAFVYFRDLRHLIAILMQIWLYATPVLYDEAMVPERYRFLIYFNPLGTVFTEIHRVLLEGQWPRADRVAITLGWMAAILTAAILIHRSYSRDLVERI